MTDLVRRYAITPQRIQILRGLLEYREALTQLGVMEGFQWIDGSFTEDVESNRGRPPADVDIVTFGYPAVPGRQAWLQMAHESSLFDPKWVKQTYQCDAYFVDLGAPIDSVLDQTVYWYGLFSHQRTTGTWKGMVRIPLVSDDARAKALL